MKPISTKRTSYFGGKSYLIHFLSVRDWLWFFFWIISFVLFVTQKRKTFSTFLCLMACLSIGSSSRVVACYLLWWLVGIWNQGALDLLNFFLFSLYSNGPCMEGYEWVLLHAWWLLEDLLPASNKFYFWNLSAQCRWKGKLWFQNLSAPCGSNSKLEPPWECFFTAKLPLKHNFLIVSSPEESQMNSSTIIYDPY